MSLERLKTSIEDRIRDSENHAWLTDLHAILLRLQENPQGSPIISSFAERTLLSVLPRRQILAVFESWNTRTLNLDETQLIRSLELACREKIQSLSAPKLAENDFDTRWIGIPSEAQEQRDMLYALQCGFVRGIFDDASDIIEHVDRALLSKKHSIVIQMLITLGTYADECAKRKMQPEALSRVSEEKLCMLIGKLKNHPDTLGNHFAMVFKALVQMQRCLEELPMLAKQCREKNPPPRDLVEVLRAFKHGRLDSKEISLFAGAVCSSPEATTRDYSETLGVLRTFLRGQELVPILIEKITQDSEADTRSLVEAFIGCGRFEHPTKASALLQRLLPLPLSAYDIAQILHTLGRLNIGAEHAPGLARKLLQFPDLSFRDIEDALFSLGCLRVGKEEALDLAMEIRNHMDTATLKDLTNAVNVLGKLKTGQKLAKDFIAHIPLLFRPGDEKKLPYLYFGMSYFRFPSGEAERLLERVPDDLSCFTTQELSLILWSSSHLKLPEKKIFLIAQNFADRSDASRMQISNVMWALGKRKNGQDLALRLGKKLSSFTESAHPSFAQALWAYGRFSVIPPEFHFFLEQFLQQEEVPIEELTMVITALYELRTGKEAILVLCRRLLFRHQLDVEAYFQALLALLTLNPLESLLRQFVEKGELLRALRPDQRKALFNLTQKKVFPPDLAQCFSIAG